jgi:hypothetical protein
LRNDGLEDISVIPEAGLKRDAPLGPIPASPLDPLNPEPQQQPERRPDTPMNAKLAEKIQFAKNSERNKGPIFDPV